MHTLDISREATPTVLAAIAAVSEHPEHAGVRELLAFVAGELGLDGGLQPELAPTPSPAELAAVVTRAEDRLAVLERLMLAAMIVPPLDAARLERLVAYASALDLASEPALSDLHNLLAGHHRRLTAALLGRFPPSERIRIAWRRGGMGDRWRLVKAMAKLPEAGTAARYRALGELPEGTLGRNFFEHCRRNGFALPPSECHETRPAGASAMSC